MTYGLPAWRQSALVVAIAAVVLCGCAARPETGYLEPVNVVTPTATSHAILVATTRERDGRPGTFFNGERSGSLDYASITVSVPPKHLRNKIEIASKAPGNPEEDFVVRKAAYIDSDFAFIQTLNAQLATRPPGQRRVLLFVHGYNTLFAEGLYRTAQIAHDSRTNSVPVLFTWASRGKVSAYLYDTNSATEARDDLEHTIRLILSSDAENVSILAHSMGNWVTVEAFRQIKISGDLANADKIRSIYLAAPDIDLDVFKSQMHRIGRPKTKVNLIISRDDRALGASRFVAGGKVRVGDASNIQELAELGVTVIDLTEVKSDDPNKHDKFEQLVDIGPQLPLVLGEAIGAGTPQPPSTVGGALGAVIGAPVRVLTGQ